MIMKNIFKILFTIVVCISNNAFSQAEFNNKAFNSFVNQELKKWKVPGAAIVVVKNGKIIYAKGFGYRNIEERLPADENTLFAIGSLTKSMTATTVGISVDKGIFKWNSKLVSLLPNFKLKDPFATQNINPVDLLCHRSGLPNHNFMWYVTDFDRKEIIRRLQYLEPSEDFRTTFQYSPNMYTLAGYLVGQKSKMTWEEFTAKNIFEPLQMHRTNFTYMDMEKDSNHSRPYIVKGDKVVETNFHHSQHHSAPAGSVNSSVKEMANWMLMNLNHGKFNGQQIISSENLSYIQSPHITFPSTSQEVGIGPEGEVYSYTMYGLGWDIQTYHDQITLSHLGGIDGFASAMALYPRINAGIVVLTNNQMGGTQFSDIVINRIATKLINKPDFDLSNWILKEMEKYKSSKKEKPKLYNSKPCRGFEDYIGTYIDEGYGEIFVSKRENKLHLKYYRFDVDLEHLNHNVFKTIKGIVNRKINFISNTSGEIDRLEIQWDRSTKPIIFEKFLE
jgi:CubicO group peptidase (beta-lactamase class C family)